MTRILLLTCCLSLAGITGVSAQTSNNMGTMPGMGSSAAAASPADRSMTSAMAGMSQDMEKAPMTGNADQDFVAMMIPHHQGAVAMAEAELRYGHDPILLKMAKDIIAAQNKEIAEMKAWQASHPAP